jgi:hypothetical protein
MSLVASAEVGIHRLEETLQTRDHRIVRQGFNNKVDPVTATICTKAKWCLFLTNLGGNTHFRSLKCTDPINPEANELRCNFLITQPTLTQKSTHDNTRQVI